MMGTVVQALFVGRNSVKKRACAMVAVVVAVSLLTTACTAGRAFRRGQDAVLVGDWDAAVAHFTKALQEDPGNAEFKIELERASLAASRVRYDKARALEEQGELEAAIFEYRKAAEYDPSNRQAVQRAANLERIVRDREEAQRPKPKIEQMREQARRDSQPPLLRPTQRIPMVRFNNASTQDILNFIGMATGINVIYEKDFRPSTFSVQLEDVTIEEALNQILAANQLWYKVLNDRTIQIIPDNAQKRQLYEDQVIRTFFLSHADPQELLQILNTITRIQGLAITPTLAANKAANTITVRATKGVADIIERIIQANDKPRAEITVDVEIIEVSRSRAKQYGLNLSQYAIGTIFSPEVSPTGGTISGGGGTTGGTSGSGTATAISVPPFNLNTIVQGISTADFYLTVPQAIVRFLASDSRSKVIAKPQLRGGEGTKLTLNLGDEIPVPSTVFTPFAAGGAATNPLTSFSYRNVGVNVEMTPRVSYEGDIMMDVAIESSTLGGNIDVAGQSLPTFGTRKVTTRLRLREGEAHLLAGLLREEERRSLRGLPGIMNLPILRQLASENDTSTTQTDIVMLLTPRVVRTHELQQQDLAPIYIGSQSNIGLTGAPQLIAPPPEEEAAPAVSPPPSTPTTPAGPSAPAVPGPRPGVPVPPAAAATGAQPPPGAAPTGVAPPQPAARDVPVRLPEGTTSQPAPPPGSSPIPGTTTLPPASPVTPQAPPGQSAQGGAPATPGPQATVPAPPAETAAPIGAPGAASPADQSATASAAQVVLTTPGSELRVGGGPYTMPLSISNASRVSTVTLSLSFNPAILRVRTIQEGSFMRQGGVAVAFNQQVDAATGRIDITLSRTGDQAGASGAGLLAAVLFEPTAAGATSLALSGLATTPQGAPVPLSFSQVSVTVR
jgi:type II secretory pathway component GspD/PulD (secretin)